MNIDTAWSTYSQRIQAAGESITGESFPDDPRLRAEGYRYVNRLDRLAQQIYVEFGDAERPVLFRYGDDTTPFGATNVDNNYYRAILEPSGSYRISGNVAGVREILFSVQDGEFIFGKTAVTAEVSLGELEIGAGGELELFLGGPARERNWLPLQEDSVYINVRTFIADWERDALAELCIERLDEVPPVGNLTPETYAAALEHAATWVEASVKVWNMYAAGARAATPVNELHPPRPAEGGAVGMLHSGCLWDLAPEQALLIEVEAPEATYWGWQTYVLEWLQPLDFTNRVTSLNDGQVHVDEDGKVRLVVAHSDPGVPNWLDTSGLQVGMVSGRWVMAATSPTPVATVIDLGDVRKYLPNSTPVFSAENRAAQVAGRRRGVARRFRG